MSDVSGEMGQMLVALKNYQNLESELQHFHRGIEEQGIALYQAVQAVLQAMGNDSPSTAYARRLYLSVQKMKAIQDRTDTLAKLTQVRIEQINDIMRRLPKE